MSETFNFNTIKYDGIVFILQFILHFLSISRGRVVSFSHQLISTTFVSFTGIVLSLFQTSDEMRWAPQGCVGHLLAARE